MTRAIRLLGGAVAVTLALGAVAGDRMRAQDAESATLTIVGAVCPVDYAGDAFAADCATTPAAGATYQVRNTQTGELRPAAGGFATADAAGVLTFDDLSGVAPGTIQILASAPPDVGVPYGYTVPAATCTAADGRAVAVALLESAYAGQIVEVEANAGDRLRCDVYFVPLAPRGSGDATPPAPDAGRAGAIYLGGCPTAGDDPVQPVAVLAGSTAPAAAPVGQAAAVVVETSFPAVPLPLAELLAGGYALGVGALGMDAAGPVACGEIGGVVDETGRLAIGLREVGDSGFTGIALLAPSAGDPARTDVAVFLAAGLAQEDAATDGTPTPR